MTPCPYCEDKGRPVPALRPRPSRRKTWVCRSCRGERTYIPRKRRRLAPMATDE